MKRGWGSSISNWVLSPAKLQFLLILVLVVGIFFRFFNIDHKVYWFDETFTSLRIAGYRESEVANQVCNNQEISAGELQKYQKLILEKNYLDTIQSLALDDPQHVPLYFLLAHFWAKLWGDSVAAIRSLSALLSLVAFPSLYWLCIELFESSRVGWFAMSLLAASPMHVLFAQEARSYSLWTVTILLSSASLLRAMRLNTRLSWGVYVTTLTLSLYTFLFSGLLSLGHTLYVISIERLRLNQRSVIHYFLALFTSIVLFTPWLVAIFNNYSRLHETTEWIITMDKSQWFLMDRWLLNTSRIFIDLNSDFGKPLIYLSVAMLSGYSIYFLCRSASQRIWLFVLALTGSTEIVLMVSDLALGGVRSVIPRYLFPYYLGLNLAVAYLFATQTTSVNLIKQRSWQIVLIALLACGILSCAISSQAEVWWIKGGSFGEPDVPKIAAIINKTTQPLVIGNCEGTWPINDKLYLSGLLDKNVKFQLVTSSNTPKIRPGFSDIFLLDPSEEFRAGINRKQYEVKPVSPDTLNLWKLTSKY